MRPYPAHPGSSDRLATGLVRTATLFVIFCVILAAGACRRPPDAAPSTLETRRQAPREMVSGPVDADGPRVDLEESDVLIVKLSDGSLEAEDFVRPPRPSTQPLSDSDTDTLLARLPPLDDPHEGQEPALPPDTRPRPRTGETVAAAFPPPHEVGPPPQATDLPLRVERFAPEGDVDLAPHVSITFNQPMVAVTSHDVASSQVPLHISPELPGKWRWVGTRTLLFELSGRLPMATSFEAVVPAGTRSALGAVLEEEVRWTFDTPPPSIESFWPHSHGAQRRDTPIVIVFDQRVDKSTILQRVQVRSGRDQHQVVEIGEEELREAMGGGLLLDQSQEGRWVAFKTAEELPYDSSVSVVIPGGTPSAEGPKVTQKDQSRSFRTYGPFRVTRSQCWGNCSPGTAWHIQFSNPVDTEAFDQSTHVRIDPELPMAQVSVHGQHMNIQGIQRARTRYQVHLSSEMKDVFGQSLERASPIGFAVGPTDPRFTVRPQPLVVLDPAAPPTFLVHSMGMRNLQVSAHRVGPQDWPAYRRWNQQQSDEIPGRRAFRRRVAIEGSPDEMSATGIDLSDALDDGFGHVVLHIEGSPQPKESWRRQQIRVWIQRTKIGLMVWQAETLEVLAMDLSTGEPVAGAQLSLFDGEGKQREASAVTDEHGRGTLQLDDTGSAILTAVRGGDTAMLPSDIRGYRGLSGWTRQEPSDRVLWYVADDRQMYRPSERASFKGWVRMAEGGPRGDIESAGEAVKEIIWRAVDPRGSDLANGREALDRFGGFSFELDIPEDTNLGNATIVLEVVDGKLRSTKRHGFRIQAFRRPEFEVSSRGSQAPHFLGDALTATVEAKYFTGEPLPGADVTWTVTQSPGFFRPPGHDRFTFGRAPHPWWRRGAASTSGQSSVTRHTGSTDGGGEHVLSIELPGGPPFATSLMTEASVMDVNRQAWASSTPFLVHPAAVYVGLASERRFINRGDDLDVEIIVADLDGEIVTERKVELSAERLVWKRVGRSWEEQVEETRSCEIATEEEPVSCSFETLEGGRWRITASVSDKRGRISKTVMDRWVSGATPPPRVSRVEQEQITLIPDQDEWKPGETARVLAQLPFYPADLVVTLRREGLLHTERVRVEGADHTIEIPIEDGHTPNLHLHVAIAGTAPRAGKDGEVDPALPPRPAFGYGSLTLRVPPGHRSLAVEATPIVEEVEPGGSTKVRVEVKNAEGEPVAGAQVLLVAVDEAVLALTGYRLPDPIGVFYTARGAGVTDASLYPSILLADLDVELGDISEPEAAPSSPTGDAIGRRGRMLRSAARPRMAMEEAPSEPSPDAPAGAPIAMRADLNPLAIFAPDLLTGAGGVVEAEIDLPDNLTRYRIMAVATDGARLFGSGESTLTARLPLMVRPSLPRFLNLGDKSDLPFVVQNQTDEDMTVALAVRTTGIDLGEAAGYRFVVPARDRVEVRLAGDVRRVGPARVQVAAASGPWADAAEITLPVWTPVTTEAFATYGTIDEGAIRQPVEAPEGARSDFGGLEITTSSTELQSLTDAVVYLVNYPFDCTEQIASRVLALSALVDVLTAFESENLPSPDELKASVAADVKTIAARQSYDGRFGLWRRANQDPVHWPYLTVHTTLALTLAQEKGFDVPSQVLDRASRYLQRIESHIPAWYSREARWSIRASALYVLHRMGRTDARKAKGLLREAGVDNLGIEAQGWLLPVLAADGRSSATQVAAIERHLVNRVSETAAGATFTTSYGDGAHLLFYSSRRTDAVVLEGLMHARPDSDLIVKTVRGLLAHRSRGRWGSTQENGWVLLALDRYFRQYEGVTPNFVARAWLGDRFAGEHGFRGRTTERHHIAVPMSWLAEHEGRQDLTLAKDGAGRMYYRIGLRYVPDDLSPPPAEHGFTVERTYEAVNDPEDVRQEEDGTWTVRAGAEVRVRLTLVAPARRYHVALVDRLPAGFEPMNPALAVTGSVPQDTGTTQTTGGRFWWWWRTWYEHQNLRDERAEAFASLLWAGVHSYSYVARATTPGRFIAPPPSAEEMYHPETFGRGKGEIVVVVEAD